MDFKEKIWEGFMFFIIGILAGIFFYKTYLNPNLTEPMAPPMEMYHESW